MISSDLENQSMIGQTRRAHADELGARPYAAASGVRKTYDHFTQILAESVEIGRIHSFIRYSFNRKKRSARNLTGER